MEQQAIYAFLLTLMAGLSTGIGSLIALVAKRTNRKFLSFSLGFSAGVMIYISFVDLFPQSIEILGADYGARGGQIATAIAFFCGILFIALIDKLVPSVENPHEMRSIESLQVDLPAAGRHPHSKHMLRTGIMTALVIGIHNFPEGIATFMASLQDTQMGIAIAVAIAIHNIPEGLSVGVIFGVALANLSTNQDPWLALSSAMMLSLGIAIQNIPEGAIVSLPFKDETNSVNKAFMYGSLSGIVEPIFALFGILLAYFIEPIMPWALALAAGCMIYVTIEDLIPTAVSGEGKNHYGIIAFVFGFLLMMALDVLLG